MPNDRSVDVDSAVDLATARATLASRAVPAVRMAGRAIGAGHQCFVIAEAGVNHNGDVKLARALVDAAIAAGADAVKFQTFRAEQLVTADAPKADYQQHTTGSDESQLAMLKRLELDEHSHRELLAYCGAKRILFLSTPFDETSADFLESLDVAAFKLPSGEVTNLPFLRHVARKHKPIILSTGMATLSEVSHAVDAIWQEGNRSLVLLHCVSNYPADPADSNLRAMATLGDAFGVPAGFSDHTMGDAMALAAVALGARVIEKHLTLDRALPGPDHQASMEPDAFRQMVERIHDVESGLGTGRKQPVAREAAVARVARKVWLPRGPYRREPSSRTDDRNPAARNGPCSRSAWVGGWKTNAGRCGRRHTAHARDARVRTIDVVTTSRADYGILLPVLRCMQSDGRLRLRVIVSGSHLSPLFGMTVRAIETDGFEIADRIDVLGSSDSAEATADAMGRGLSGFGRHFARSRPDVLVVLGDRFEMHSAAAAALPFRLPVAHIHGGEVTTGAFDDALRQSMTKLSHLHFVYRRGSATGAAPGRRAVACHHLRGALLDNLRRVRLRTRQEVEVETGLRVPEQFALVTFHPATVEETDPAAQMGTLLDTLENGAIPAIVTMPNADPGARAVRAVIEARAQLTSAVQPVENLGTDLYFSLMAHASAMVGNSSSGIIEAASFALPVVNIGSRQNGRERTGNVIDVAASGEAIAAGLRRALMPSFKASLAGMSNLYGDGHAAERIVERLSGIDLTPALIQKQPSDAEPA